MVNSAADNLDLRIRNSAGMEVWKRLERRSFTLNIFLGNSRELTNALEALANPKKALHLAAHNNRQTGVQAHREVIRLFHNFLASAMTLVDQTRVFIAKHYQDTDIARLYKAQAACCFATSGLHAFVQELRNIMLHRGLPKSERHISFMNGELESGVRYSRDELLQCGSWKPHAREFLLSLPDKIVLLDICRQYEDLVLGFHEWLNLVIKNYHRVDLEELERVQSDYNKTT